MAQTNGATNIGSALSDLNFTREQIIQCSILHKKWRQVQIVTHRVNNTLK